MHVLMHHNKYPVKKQLLAPRSFLTFSIELEIRCEYAIDVWALPCPSRVLHVVVVVGVAGGDVEDALVVRSPCF